MPLLRGIPLHLLMPVSWSAYSGSLHFSATVVFFSHLPYNYTNVLNYLKFHTLNDRRCHLDAFFLLNVFIGSKFRPTLLQTVGLQARNRNFRDFKLFHVDFSRRTVLPLDAHRRLMASLAVVVHSIVGQFWLTICHQVSGFRGFAPVLLHYFFPAILVLFCSL
jgi:hypothetical protein